VGKAWLFFLTADTIRDVDAANDLFFERLDVRQSGIDWTPFSPNSSVVQQYQA
jgi:hypothetical protein